MTGPEGEQPVTDLIEFGVDHDDETGWMCVVGVTRDGHYEVLVLTDEAMGR